MLLRRPRTRMLGQFGFALAFGAFLVLPIVFAQSPRGTAAPEIPQHTSSNTATGVSPGDWQQLVKLISGRGEATDFFANSVGISGDAVVVASDTNYVNTVAGFVYVKSTSGWASPLPVAGLKLPSPVDRIFTYVAIDKDTVVIGTPSGFSGYPSYAYVFVKPANGWKNMMPTAVLTPSDSMDGYFGQSISVWGDTVVVGDPAFESSSPGAVYVYTKPAGGWQDMTQTAKLTASDGVADDALGDSVSIRGTTIAAGAPQLPGSGGGGKAYIFVEPAGGWANMTQTAELTVPTSPAGSDIGTSIYVNDSWALVGAPSFSNCCVPGSAYVFSKPASGWTNMTETATLTPGDQRPGSEFGESVSGSDNVAIVGADRRGAPPFGLEGGVYVFTEPASGWQDMSGSTVLTGSDARNGNFLGATAAISGKTVVAGAQNFYTTGAAYVFGLP
jgi:hypothetical protein